MAGDYSKRKRGGNMWNQEGAKISFFYFFLFVFFFLFFYKKLRDRMKLYKKITNSNTEKLNPVKDLLLNTELKSWILIYWRFLLELNTYTKLLHNKVHIPLVGEYNW